MEFQKQRAPIPRSFQCFLHSLHPSQLHNSLPSIVRIGWLGQKEPPASLVQIWLALSMRLASVFGENSAMYSASYAGTIDRKDRRMLFILLPRQIDFSALERQPWLQLGKAPSNANTESCDVSWRPG